MEIIADLHIHSRFSRACSTQLTIPNLEKYAKIKGVDLLGTGDFTHPQWIEHLKQELVKEENGIYYTKNNFPFIFTTEISLIYTQEKKGRRVHNVVFAPNLDVVKQITEYLLKKGRIDYDGRPIFKISCVEFVEDLRKISDKIEIIPSHIWTPFFGALGSKSGFDSVEEAFQDQTKHIHALETGLSSDPPMNWRLSKLDKFALVSFSDLHSFWPWRMAREATTFDIKLSYDNILKALRTKQGLIGTIEVNPAYGKYHWDGHRACNVSLSPQETKKLGGICPKCGNKLTIGVENRVEELADREEGFKPKDAIEFKRLIPLSELISTVLNIKQLYSKKVFEVHTKLMNEFKNEFNVLLNIPFEDLKKIVDEKLAELIIKNREGKINISPGADGVYGEIVLDKKQKIQEYKPSQKTLNNF